MFTAGPWYYGNQLHKAFLAAGTPCDIYSGEFEHDVLK
jgi:hypothetical protein